MSSTMPPCPQNRGLSTDRNLYFRYKHAVSPLQYTYTLSRPSPGARVLRHSAVKPTPETCLRGPFPPSNQEKGEEKKYSET